MKRQGVLLSTLWVIQGLLLAGALILWPIIALDWANDDARLVGAVSIIASVGTCAITIMVLMTIREETRRM